MRPHSERRMGKNALPGVTRRTAIGRGALWVTSLIGGRQSVLDGAAWDLTWDVEAALAPVANRGRPPLTFLNPLITWARSAEDAIFERNDRRDTYGSVVRHLGPWRSLTHRKAAMLEVLRVLGAFESTWDWKAVGAVGSGRTPQACRVPVGAFQCSADSMAFDPSLKKLLAEYSGGSSDCDAFCRVTKSHPVFAIEYCARLLRFTARHHGPILRKKIHPWLRRDSVAEFERLLVA